MKLVLLVLLSIGGAKSFSNETHPRFRIFNGQLAGYDAFPFAAAMYIDRMNANRDIRTTLCGASLISALYLLTAAHCVNRDPIAIDIFMGTTSLEPDGRKGRVEMIAYKDSVRSHAYDGETKNDIALIKLPNRVKLSKQIQPAKLPKSKPPSLVGRAGHIVGWGQTGNTKPISDQLRYITARIKPDNICKSIFGDIYHNTNLCVDAIHGSPCTGDSGGGLVIDEGGVYTIYGVFSFFFGRNCESGLPVAFTRVSKYVDWIKQKTGIK